jgi:hypothetical protein
VRSWDLVRLRRDSSRAWGRARDMMLRDVSVGGL